MMQQSQIDPLVPLGRFGHVLIAGTAVTAFVTISILGAIRETDQFSGIFFALFLYCTTLVLPLLFLKDRASWFHPLIFGSCWSLLQMIRRSGSYYDGMSMHFGIPGFSVSELNDLIWQLLLIQVLAQLSLCIGFFVGPKQSDKVLLLGRSDPSMKLMLLVGMVGTFYYFYLGNKGGLSEHMLDLGKGRVRQIEEVQMFGASVAIINLATFAVLVLAAYVRSSTHYLMLGAVVPILLFMNYTVSGSRSAAVYALILLLIARSIATRRIRWSMYIIGAVAAVIAIGALGQVRRGSWGGASGLDRSLANMSTADSFLEGIMEIELRGAELNPVYAIMARVPEEVPYLLGKSYITLVTAPIPRAMWMGKPRTTGALVGPTFFNSDAGMPPGPIGEALWNFGLPGVVLVYVLFGAIQRYLYVWFLNQPSNPVAIAIYCISLFSLQPDVLSIVSWLQITLLGYLSCRLLGIVRPASAGEKAAMATEAMKSGPASSAPVADAGRWQSA
jgi:oligosaccharide repeat unit polymerase